MKEGLYWGIIFVVFILQMLLCLKAKRRIVRLCPLLLVLLTMAISVAAYALSDFTNWAWLIILMLQSGALVPIALAWILFGITRLRK